MAKRPKLRKASAPTIALNAVQQIPLSQLVLSPANVRTIYDEAGIEALAHSIAQRGLLQSLSVRPAEDDPSRYEVQAGGRRFRALTRLAAEGRLASDAPVACIVKTTGLAADDSLAENSDRVDLHPLDEFKAFAALRAAGQSDADIAAAYRVSTTVVRQRLRMAAASPVILDAYRSEEINLDQLMAFCIVDDHGKQEDVFKRLITDGVGYNDDASAIKRALTETSVQLSDRRAKFVGVAAYEAAGGAVLRDLFSEDRVYLLNPTVLDELVASQLASLRAELLAAGWKWVEAAESIDWNAKRGLDRLVAGDATLTDEQQTRLSALETERDQVQAAYDAASDQDEETEARLEALQAEIDALENQPPVFADHDKARAGVFVSLDYNGALTLDYGYIRPEDRDVVNEDTGSADPDLGDTALVTTPTHEIEDSGLADKLTQELTSYRTIGLRNALADDFDTAFLAVLHVLVLQHFYTRSSYSCMQLTVTSGPALAQEALDGWKAAKAIKSRDQVWHDLLPDDHQALWQALQDMPMSTRQSLFAHCASYAVNAVRAPHAMGGDPRHVDQLATTLGHNMAMAGWTATAQNYFGRVKKTQILDAVREAKGDDTAELLSDLKKHAMATEAERLLQGTGWLPPLLRTQAEQTDAETLPDFLADTSESEHAAA